MSANKKLTESVKNRISNAHKIVLDWESACSEQVLKLITAHADAIGSPKHYIFFPLLTVIASFMGISARVKIMKNGLNQPYCGT